MTSSVIYLIKLGYVKQKLKADKETSSSQLEYQLNDLTILAFILLFISSVFSVKYSTNILTSKGHFLRRT